MKRIYDSIGLLAILTMVSGCFGGGGGGGGGGDGSVNSSSISAYSCYSDFTVGDDGSGNFTVDGKFCDNNITFPANALVVSNPPFKMRDIWNSIIPYAYAANPNQEPVSCKENDIIPPVTVDVLRGKSVVLTGITCSEDMDLAIRQAVADKAIANETLIAEYDDGKVLRYDDEANPPVPVILTTGAAIAGSVIDQVPQGDSDGKCFNKYTFDNSGKVTIELDTNITQNADKQNCLDRGGRYYNHLDVELPIYVSASELAALPSYSIKCKKTIYARRHWDATLNDGDGGWELSRDNDGNLIEVDPEEPNAIQQVQQPGPCTEFNYKRIARYRFRDGFIEIDKQPEYVSENGGTKASFKFSDGVNLNSSVKSNTKRFRLNEYTRFCIKSSVNACDGSKYNGTFVTLPNSDDY